MEESNAAATSAWDWGEQRVTVGRYFVRDMESLWSESLKLAAVVEESLIQSIQALCDGRVELADEIRRRSRAVDRWEVQIERECVRVLALHQPVASDLRRVAAVLKINGDLHRLCDLARHIAKRVKKLAADPQALPVPQPSRTWAGGADQVHDSLDALTRSNVTLAQSVIDADQRIDRQYRPCVKQLKQEIVSSAADQHLAPAGQHRTEPRAHRRPRREDRRVGRLPRARRKLAPSAGNQRERRSCH